MLDAISADDSEVFGQVLAAVRMVAMPTNDCMLFTKGEKADVYERDFPGSWIVVGKRGEAGR